MFMTLVRKITACVLYQLVGGKKEEEEESLSSIDDDAVASRA